MFFSGLFFSLRRSYLYNECVEKKKMKMDEKPKRKTPSRRGSDIPAFQ